MFEIGSIVKLKSGGPKMTITGHLSAENSVSCTWFSSDKIVRDQFPAESLILVELKELTNEQLEAIARGPLTQ